MNDSTTRLAAFDGYGMGKRNPLDDPHKGPIADQMAKGRPNTTIKVDTDSRGCARIARLNRIAGGAAEIEIKRLFRRKDNGAFAFFYAIEGELDNTALEEINLLSDLLRARFQADYAEYLLPAGPLAEKPLGIRISFKHNAVYLYVEMKFEREWQPAAVYTEIQ